MKKKLNLIIIVVGWAVIILGAAGVWGDPGDITYPQIMFYEQTEDVISITMEEIWEVLQIVEQRITPPQLRYTISVYDPCPEDPICMAKKEVKRLEQEKAENEKIRALINKFREVMK